MLALILTATLNLGAQSYREYRDEIGRQELYEKYRMFACKLRPSIDESSRLYIELTLLVAFVGTRLKRVQGKLLYCAGLIGTTIYYFLWWRYYFRFAEIAGSELKFVESIAYLYQATYLDICIAVSIALLLLWEFSWAILLLFRLNSSRLIR